MKRGTWIGFSILALALSACAGSATQVVEAPTGPSQTKRTTGGEPTPSPSLERTATPLGGATATPEWLANAETYRDMRVGFALDYPSGWHLQPVSAESMQEAHVYTVTITSWEPEVGGKEGIPESGTKVDVGVIKSGASTPEEAIEGRLRELRQEGSEQEILNQARWTLAEDLPALRMRVGSIFGAGEELVTGIGGHTVLLGGLGEIELLDQIFRTLRPVEAGEQGGGLPSAVVYLHSEEGQPSAPGDQHLWRVNPDGSRTEITEEGTSITGFAVSPLDGAIAYSTFGENAIYRINADGSGRVKLFQGPKVGQGEGGQIANLAWSPDGAQIAFGMGGVHLLPFEGGEPTLLVANKERPEVEPTDQRLYAPVSFSPQGDKLLLSEAIGLQGSSYAVLHLAEERLVSLGPGNFCCDPTWGLEGESFYFANAVYGMFVPGLWRADARSGEITTLVEGYAGQGDPVGSGEPMRLFNSAQQLSEGYLHAFSATGTYEQLFQDAQGNAIAPHLWMSRYSLDTGETERLRSEAYPVAGTLWALEGSGAVVVALGAGEWTSGTLLWLPVGEGEPVILAEGAFQPQWGE